jgi:hypothetical protein
MDYPEEHVLAAARTIRSVLHGLSPSTAEDLDSQVAELLARAKTGERVGAGIIDVLSKQDATRSWMQFFLATGSPRPLSRGFQHLPGDPKPVPGTKFECPDGDFTWYRPFVGVPVPQCPTHKKPLVQLP